MVQVPDNHSIRQTNGPFRDANISTRTRGCPEPDHWSSDSNIRVGTVSAGCRKGPQSLMCDQDTTGTLTTGETRETTSSVAAPPDDPDALHALAERAPPSAQPTFPLRQWTVGMSIGRLCPSRPRGWMTAYAAKRSFAGQPSSDRKGSIADD